MTEKIDLDEAMQRLNTVVEMCTTALNGGRPMLNYEYDLLRQIRSVADCSDEPVMRISDIVPENPINHVIISCDASITENPGGQVAVGAVIEYKNDPPMEIYRRTKSKTNNQGEYDAIYMGLTQLFSLKHNPGCPVEVRSDNKLAIDQLNGKIACRDQKLQAKKQRILELVKQLPVPIKFEWRPRNSTAALTKANYIAQDALGIKRH